MSVPLHKRSENKLDAYVKTLAMVKYTMQMIENETLLERIPISAVHERENGQWD